MIIICVPVDDAIVTARACMVTEDSCCWGRMECYRQNKAMPIQL